MTSTCVVGLGSPHGDDQFGWLVADRIALEVERRLLTAASIRRAGSPVQLLDWLDGVECLFVIDVCRGLSISKQLQRFEWPAQELEHARGSGSHDYTLWQTLELANQLGRLPPRCRLWCATGLQFGTEAAISPSLLALVRQVADDVLSDLALRPSHA